MKRHSLIQALLLAGTLAAGAQTNCPTPAGVLADGRQMLSVGNYAGCVDRANVAGTMTLTPGERAEASWIRARAAYLGGLPEADVYIREFISRYPASVHRYSARLMEADLMLLSRPDRAYEALTAIDPAGLTDAEQADREYHRAYALMRLGKYDEAATAFASLRGDREYGTPAAFYAGYCLYARGKYEQAATDFEAMRGNTMYDRFARFCLAQIYYLQGNDSRAAALAADMRAYTADPAVAAEGLRLTGETDYFRGDAARARRELTEYVEAVENPMPSALYIMGVCEYERGNWDAAVKYLEPVTKIDSAMGQSAYLYIGEAMMKSGDKDAAIMAFDAALRMGHDESLRETAYYNYAVAKFSGASIPFGSSVATFEDFLRRYPEGPYTAAVQEYLVSGYLSDNDYETALASINRMHNPGPKVLAAKQQVLYALGTASLSRDDASKAREYLDEAASLASYGSSLAPSVQLSLGEALYRLGENSGAEAAIGRYLASAPATDVNRPLGEYDLGYAIFAQRRYAEAAPHFKNFIRNASGFRDEIMADALNRLGDTYLYTDEFDRASDYYGQAAHRAPSSADYPLFQQAVISGYKRQYDDKLATLATLMERFPTSSLIPDALLEKAESQIQLGRKADAVATYRELTDRYAATAQGRRGYVGMAMMLLDTGRRNEAYEAYKAVIRNYPTSDEALVAVEELQRMAAEDGTLGEFAAFLRGVENAPQLDISEVERITFETAEERYVSTGNPDRLQAYLNDYPDGVYRGNAWAYLMEQADNAGNTADALTYAALIVENYPDSRSAEGALAVKARAEHSLGRGNDALRTWQLLEQRASTPAMANEARVGIMRVARDLDDNDLVIRAADALLASSTAGAEDRAEAVFARSLALDLKGETAEARRGWESLAGDLDNLYGAKSTYYLAQSLFDGKDLAGAERRVNTIIDEGTPHTYWLARAFILLSDIHAARGDKFQAREYLRSLRENYPGTETDIFQMIDSRLSDLK